MTISCITLGWQHFCFLNRGLRFLFDKISNFRLLICSKSPQNCEKGIPAQQIWEVFFTMAQKNVCRRQKVLTFQTNLLRLAFSDTKGHLHILIQYMRSCPNREQTKLIYHNLRASYVFCNIPKYPDTIVCQWVGVNCTVFAHAANRFTERRWNS